MKTSIAATFESYCSHPFLNTQKAPVHALGIAHATIWEALHSCYTPFLVLYTLPLWKLYTVPFSVLYTPPFWKLHTVPFSVLYTVPFLVALHCSLFGCFTHMLYTHPFSALYTLALYGCFRSNALFGKTRQSKPSS